MRTAARRLWGSILGPPTFSDDFNRANGPVGNGWTTYEDTGAPAISGNVVTRGTSVHEYEISRVLGFTPSSLQIDISGNASGSYTHIFCGTTDGGSLFNFTGVSLALGQPGGVFTIFTWVAGVATSRATAGASPGSGPHTLTLTKSGNVYTGFLNGSSVVSYTGSGIENWGTSVAVGAGSSATVPIQLDNFLAA